MIVKGLTVERWRVSAWLRCYRGYGLPRFEFEFRIGWKRDHKQPFGEVVPDYAFTVWNHDTNNAVAEFASVWDAEECAATMRAANPGLEFSVLDLERRAA